MNGCEAAPARQARPGLFGRLRGACSAPGAALPLSRETLRPLAALFGSNLTASLFSAAGGLLVARFVEPAENGAFRAFTIPLTYLVFLHLGTWDGLWRQIPYYLGKGMPQRVEALVRAAGAYNLALSIGGSAAFASLALFSAAQHDLRGAAGWLSQAFCCWGVFYGGFLGSTYRTLNGFVGLARLQVFQSLMNFALVFSLPLLGFFGLCARAALPASAFVWLLHRNRPLCLAPRFDGAAFRELVHIGLPFSIWGNLYTSFWTATESALVLSLGGKAELGLFAVATVMGGALSALPAAAWQVLTPRMVTDLAREGDLRGASRRLRRAALWLTLAMVLVALAGGELLELAVPLLLPKYAAGTSVMKACLWFPVLQAALLPVNALFAAGRPWLYGRSVIAGLLVFPLATYLLLPVTGAALAVALGSLCGRGARTAAAYLDLALATRVRP